MAQPLMGLPRQPFKQPCSFPGAGENDPASQLFDQFCSANTFQGIMDTFQQLCDLIGLHPVDHQIFYKHLKTKLLSWKAQSLWTKLDKRAANLEYKKGMACNKTRALVIGSGPCGLRMAIEIALLGGKVVLVEKREGFSRNNVLHLWPFLIHDLKALGAKKFFGKFCAGAIDHISIRALQCILLKVALLVGVEVHSGITFDQLLEPSPGQAKLKIGWRAKVTPAEHPVSEFVFDVCISADGKRNTMTEFKRKEFRGKLAIAITANFINRNTKAEACVEEISGVAYIFNQQFFKDLNRHAGIDLENIVYYKDETHYFVMTAKKQSLLIKGVLLQDYDDPERLLSKQNVDQQALLEYARQAADMSTQHRLPNLEFAHNHYGQPDVAMFDFTSMFAAEHACRVVERQGYRLLVALVGDTLLEPFWPTGSGCARGFLGAFDTAWMIRSWASGKMTPLEVISERESIYQLLSQTTPENLNKNYLHYTIDPNTRYQNLGVQFYKPHQVASQYDGHDTEYLNEIVRQSVQQSNRYDAVRDSHNLLKWLQRQLESYQSVVKVVDLSSSWRSGLALCALIHRLRPELLDVYSLDPNMVEANNQLAFDIIRKEFGIAPIMTGEQMAQCDAPDKISMTAYLSRISAFMRRESAAIIKTLGDKEEMASKSRLVNIGNRIRQRREEMERNDSSSLKRFQDPFNLHDVPSKRVKDLCDANTSFDILEGYGDISKYTKIQKELRLLQLGVRGQNKVSVIAKDLASKLSGENIKPAEESGESIGKGQPPEICYFCKARVYTVERYIAEGLLFHRGCLRCDYCGNPLRISYYSFKSNGKGEGKFYCVQHHGLVRPTKSSSGQGVPVSSIRGVPTTKFTMSPPKVSAVTEPYLRSSAKEPSYKKTPERVEYVTESEVEESEYEQTKHNLCSVLRPSAFSDSDRRYYGVYVKVRYGSSSEEELHFSDQDASDEQPDLTWADIARKYNQQLRQKKATIKSAQKHGSSASSGSETETVEGASDADWETDSNTDKENFAEDSDSRPIGDPKGIRMNSEKQKGSRDEFSKHLLSLSPKQNIRHESKPSPTSVEIMRNRMAFFSAVSQPVRIDAHAFLGLVPPPIDEDKLSPNEPESAEAKKDAVEVETKQSTESEKEKDDTENIEVWKIKLANGPQDRTSKRHAEKKPVTQKVKKRTKRRKKEEKKEERNRVTADVESTKLSTMHEAVPVVSISGATSSDEQGGEPNFENQVDSEIPSVYEDNAFADVTNDLNGDKRETGDDEMENGDDIMEIEILEGHHSVEEAGSSRSKSSESQVSETSQTLQYTDSDELVSPRGGLLSAEAMMNSKKAESDKEDRFDAVHSNLEKSKTEQQMKSDWVEVEKVKSDHTLVYSREDEYAQDLFDNLNETEQKTAKVQGDETLSKDKHQTAEEFKQIHEDTDEDNEKQKLDHEYVMLEETAGVDNETGKFSPYEELVTDGSEKEYTKIEIGSALIGASEAQREVKAKIVDSDISRKDGIPEETVNEFQSLVVVEELTVVKDVSFSMPSTSETSNNYVSETGKLCTPGAAPRAESESYSDEDGGVKIGKFYSDTNAGQVQDSTNGHYEDWLTASISQAGSVEDTHGELEVGNSIQSFKKVALEETGEYLNETLATLEAQEMGETWPMTTEEIMADTSVQLSACKILKLAPVSQQFQNVVTSASIKNSPVISNGERDDDDDKMQKYFVTDVYVAASQAHNKFKPKVQTTLQEQKMLDPLTRINLLLESLSTNMDGGLSESEAGMELLLPSDIRHSMGEDVKVERPNSLVISESKPEDLQSSDTSHSDVSNSLTSQDKFVSDIHTQKMYKNELSSDSSLFNASTTSGSADFVGSLQRELVLCTELTSATDDSISDGRQGTSFPTDDGSIYQVVVGTTESLNEDSLSLENVVEVNIEGEDIADLEVEVWPRVVLEDKSLGNQDLGKHLAADASQDLFTESTALSTAAPELKQYSEGCTSEDSSSLHVKKDAPDLTENSKLKIQIKNSHEEDEAGVLHNSSSYGDQTFDQKSISLASSSSTSSVLSPNRILDAKRRFFFEAPRPLRIDHRKVFRDIPTAKQEVVATEVSGEESSQISEEFDAVSASNDAEAADDKVDTAVENEVTPVDVPIAPHETEVESKIPAGEKGTILSIVSASQSPQSISQSTKVVDQLPQPVLPTKAAERGTKQPALQKSGSSSSDKGRVQGTTADLKSKRQIFKEKKRPNSAFVVMEENWRSKVKGSPVSLIRPTSAKPAPQTSQKMGSPVLGTQSSHPKTQASQSDGTGEASPSLTQKDKENRLKSFYQQKTKGRDSNPPVASKETHDKKDKKKSLLALLIPSRSLDKKDKTVKSPVFLGKSRQAEQATKPKEETGMAVVREKTKSLPLEKKRAPQIVEESKKMPAQDKSSSKGKTKPTKPGKADDEPIEAGHSIYKEIAGIMEGIKKVERRNRDKNSIRDRIEAVAPPPAKAPNTVLLPPKADIEDFETESELGDDGLSLRSFQSQMHLLSEEESTKLKKRQQKAARRKQREKELKRLHTAQEIQQHLEEVEMRQREIEAQGVEIEKALNKEGADQSRDEASLVQQWFNIVHERNILMAYESELMVQARELELEDRQSRLEIQLRERIPLTESQRTDSLKEEEEQILQELMEVVEQRDALVDLLEEDRIRQQQYSKNLEKIMVDRGFQLNPISRVRLPQALASLQEER